VPVQVSGPKTSDGREQAQSIGNLDRDQRGTGTRQTQRAQVHSFHAASREARAAAQVGVVG
jgi:hypothetical protein